MRKTKKKAARKPTPKRKPIAPPPVQKPREKVHYTAPYLINPPHPITINLVGVGGTGSRVLTRLAEMNHALKELGHTGFYVRAIDPDKVTNANIGRQSFSPADVGAYKAISLVGKINRYYGLNWEGVPAKYPSTSILIPTANITITCVDTGKARKEIKALLALKGEGGYGYQEPFNLPYYWIDFGNMKDRGQMVIGTLRPIAQPAADKQGAEGTANLPTIDKLHPDIFRDNKKDNQGPSCSLAEALGKQDLFINPSLADMGMNLLWKMFRECRISYHGLYINLETSSVNPIKVQ